MHDKTYLKPCYKKLKHLSKKPDWYLTGILESLFIYTINNSYLGNLSPEQFYEFVIWAEYTEGDAKDLLKLLINSGWIHNTQEHGLVVHDWHDIAPDFITRKAKRNKQHFPSEQISSLTIIYHDQSRPVITNHNQPCTTMTDHDRSCPVSEESKNFESTPNNDHPCPTMTDHDQSCTTMTDHSQSRPVMVNPIPITQPNHNLTQPNHNQTSSGGGELETYRKTIKKLELVEQFKPYLDCKDESKFYQTVIRWQRDYPQPIWEMMMLQAIDNGKTLPPAWFTRNLEAKKTEFLENPDEWRTAEPESDKSKISKRIDAELRERCEHIKRYSNDDNFNLEEWLKRKEQQKRIHDLPEAESSKHWDEYQSLISGVAA